jgi:hypothetical protein
VTNAPHDSIGRPLAPHVDRYRPCCTTDAQRAEFDRLVALNKTPWPERRQGRSVIGEARRYFETCDPEKIGAGLYDFSIMGSGGFDDIAHYNLHGFRAEYPHPMLYLSQLIALEVERWPMSYRLDPDGYHSFKVYTDGMHAGQVAHAIVKLANDHAPRIGADFTRRVRERETEELRRLADKLGVAIQWPLL